MCDKVCVCHVFNGRGWLCARGVSLQGGVLKISFDLDVEASKECLGVMKKQETEPESPTCAHFTKIFWNHNWIYRVFGMKPWASDLNHGKGLFLTQLKAPSNLRHLTFFARENDIAQFTFWNGFMFSVDAGANLEHQLLLSKFSLAENYSTFLAENLHSAWVIVFFPNEKIQPLLGCCMESTHQTRKGISCFLFQSGRCFAENLSWWVRIQRCVFVLCKCDCWAPWCTLFFGLPGPFFHSVLSFSFTVITHVNAHLLHHQT